MPSRSCSTKPCARCAGRGGKLESRDTEPGRKAPWLRRCSVYRLSSPRLVRPWRKPESPQAGTASCETQPRSRGWLGLCGYVCTFDSWVWGSMRLRWQLTCLLCGIAADSGFTSERSMSADSHAEGRGSPEPGITSGRSALLHAPETGSGLLSVSFMRADGGQVTGMASLEAVVAASVEASMGTRSMPSCRARRWRLRMVRSRRRWSYCCASIWRYSVCVESTW